MRTTLALTVWWSATAVGTMALAQPAILLIADFETGKDGFSGPLQQDKTISKVGKACGRILADFSEKGNWVTCSKNLSQVQSDFLELRFWIKSTEARRIAVRLKDSTGQDFQQRPSFEPDGEWHLISIRRFDAGEYLEVWGGAGDRQWHPPAQSISLTLEKGALTNAKGTVWIDRIEAVLDPRPVVPLLDILSHQLGNVFLTTEEVTVPVVTAGTSVSWQVTDFLGNLVASGEEKTVDAKAEIRPPRKRGYFLMRIEAKDGERTIAQRDTSFAVITPINIRDMPANPFGVMTHFAQGWDTDIMPLIARAGIGSIRDEHYWAQVEREKGVYNFSDRSNAYMAAAKELGIEPLIAMTFENKLYDQGLTPYTPDGCDAYGRYGQAILKQYGEQIRWLEIWNEYNGTWCKGPAAEDRPKYYTQMLKQAYQRIKEVRPDVQVLGCAAVLIPLPYLEGIFDHGGLDYMDAVAIHPYRNQPEGVEREVAALQELIQKYNNGNDKPVWVTETGRSDKSEYEWEKGKNTFELGRENVARYLVRQYVLLRSVGVEKIYWYLCRDYQNFTTMGLLRDPKDRKGRYAVAPAYVAYANLIRQLYGAQPAEAAQIGEHVRICSFTRGGDVVRVCWATQPTHIILKTDEPVVVTDMMGDEETLHPSAGEVYLTLTDTPVYVIGQVHSVAEHGRFELAGEQKTDMLSDVALEYALDNTGAREPLSGFLEIQGRRYPIQAGSDARQTGWAVIPGQDTSQPRSLSFWYRLVLGGKTVGKGGLVAHVVDPLSFPVEPRAVGPGALEVRLANHSKYNDYSLTSLRLKVADSEAVHAVSVTLPREKTLALRLPINPLPPYQSVPAEVEATFARRTALRQTGEILDNPCPPRSVTVDGDLNDWQGATPIVLESHGRRWGTVSLSGQAWIAWDAARFYLALRVNDEFVSPPASHDGAAKGDRIRFGLAPLSEGKWHEQDDLTGWYEYTAALTPRGPELLCTLAPGGMRLGEVPGGLIAGRRVADDMLYEVGIPWSAAKPIAPADGAVRFSFLVTDHDPDGQSGWVEWGSGIGMGKTPDKFRVCRLDSGGVPQQLTQPVMSTAALGLAEPGFVTRATLADSAPDYSNEQGAKNWWYGFFDGDGTGDGNGTPPAGPYTDDDFEPMQYVQTAWGYNWAGPAKYLSLSERSAHPEVMNGWPVWAVRRWKCPVAGKIRLSGFFSRADKRGDGTQGRILVDGVQVYEVLVGGQSGFPDRAQFDLIVPVREGTLVDFCITPGPGVDTLYDASRFEATICMLKP